MRKAGAGVAGLALLPPLLCAAPALAADAAQSLVVDGHAWSWRRAVLPAGLPADEPSQVPPGDLAVAYDGSPDATPAKATYLHLDLSEVPATATVASLKLTLPVDPAAQTVDTGGARLIACRLLSDFTSGEATDPASMPEADCTGAAPGTFDAAASAWSFSLTAVARDWLAGANHGVQIRPALDYAAPADAPFQIDFVGATELRADLVVAPPAAPAPEPAPQPAPPAAAGGSDLSSVTGPPALPVGPPVPAPAALGPAPAAAPAVVAPAPVAAPVRRAAVVLPPPRYSTGALYSFAGLLVLLLVAVSRAVGDTAGPLAQARAERRRLDRLRRPAQGSVVVPLPVGQAVQSRQGRRPMSAAASTVT